MQNIFQRRYLISLVYLLVVVTGVMAWRNIPLELAPNLQLPSVTVSYTWGSTSPEVMEKEITRKVEQASNRLRDVEQVESYSRPGQSTVTITFRKGTPVDYRMVELREYLSGLDQSLPPAVSPVHISRQVPEEISDLKTFVVYSISGNRPTRELLQYARRNIKLELLALDGLADITISGARDPALMVHFHTNAVDKLGLHPGRILSQIHTGMGWRSSGYIQKSGSRYSLLVPPQFSNLQAIRSMNIKLPASGQIIPLSKVADVSMEDYPVKSLKRINGSPALGIEFIKEPGADAIGLASSIRKRMKGISQRLPADMHLQLERDATDVLRDQFGQLQYQALISLLVVFLVLLLFIRRLRAPFVILGSIGFSLLLSVGILNLIGYTLNIITLAGLTVSLGLIIDNAVVVFEQLNPGLPAGRPQRIHHVARELPHTLVPVFGSTLTTVGIFLPLFFAMEDLRIFLVPLAVALTLALGASIFIALSWIPYSLIWLVPTQSPKDTKNELFSRFKKPFQGGRHAMLWLLTWRHRLRWFFYFGLITLIGIPLFAIPEPHFDEGTLWPEFTRVYFNNRHDIDPWVGGLTYRFFNETRFGSPFRGSDQWTINVNIRCPQGTPLEEIDKIARNYEKIVRPYEDAFSFYQTNVSEYSGARLTFYIKKDYLDQPEPYIFFNEAMYLAARTGNSSISVFSRLGQGISTSLGNSSSSNYRITLKGYSFLQLLNLANDLKKRLIKNRRVQGVDINQTRYFNRGKTSQYELKLNEEELAILGLNRTDLLNSIGLDVNPVHTAGRVEMDGQSMYLIGRNKDRRIYQSGFMRQKRQLDSLIFNLNEVSHLTQQPVQPFIRRQDQSYFRVVGVNFLGPYKLGKNVVQKVIDETPVPIGASIDFGNGSLFNFNNEQNVHNLLLVLGLSLLAVWMIVSALLESWGDPLLVIMAVPFSLIGIMAGTLHHDLAFDRGAIAGTLLCVGVVVNNAILLMHEKDRVQERGIYGLRCWWYVYKNKMRAVLITSLTTLGGLVPIIILGHSEFWTQLATITCWGLGTSTLLVLAMTGIWTKVGNR